MTNGALYFIAMADLSGGAHHQAQRRSLSLVSIPVLPDLSSRSTWRMACT
jgi:hypothetical protein